MTRNKDKKRLEKKLLDPERVDEQIRLRLSRLMIKEMEFKQWIAEDSHMIMKSETHVVMEISPADVGASADEFQKITADQSAVMVFYDYNKPVSIELPAEALKAS